MEIFDFNDETVKINTDGYLVPRLYVVIVVIDETVYKFLFESFKELFVRL